MIRLIRCKFFLPIFMMAFFVLSRCLYWEAGVRFDASTMSWFWQFLDTDLLVTDLCASIWDLHMQAPVFNLAVGLLLKCGGGDALFHASYMVLGLVLFFATHGLMTGFGVNRFVACGFASIFIVSPSVVLYENWLFYTYPIMCILTLGCWFTQRGMIRRNPWCICGAVLCFAVTAMLHSLFHVVWFIGLAIALFAFAGKKGGRRVMFVAFVCTILIGAWYTKNYIRFGFAGTSSWGGMSLYKVASAGVPESVIHKLVTGGILPEIAQIEPFSPISKYPERYLQPSVKGRHPALLNRTKSNGQPNMNHTGYIQLGKDYQRAAIALIAAYPRAYVSTVVRSWFVYFKPASDYVFLRPNAAAMGRWLTGVQRCRNAMLVDLSAVHSAMGGVSFRNQPYSLMNLILIGGGMCIAFAWAISCAWRKHRPSTIGFCACLMVAIIGYVAVMGNLLEVGENNRFRVMTDSLLYCLVVASICDWIGERRNKRVLGGG